MSSDFRSALLALTAVLAGGWLLDARMQRAGLASLNYERTAVASVLNVARKPPAKDLAAHSGSATGAGAYATLLASNAPITLLRVDEGPPPVSAAQARAAEQRATAAHELRVCADPDNLPYSDRAGRGFENAIAELVARDLGRTVRYTWWPQRRGFIRHTLDAGRCDVVMSVPKGYEPVRPTIPYYRSTYVFVTVHRRRLAIASFDDPRLAHLTIGLASTGDALTPPAQALAMRGLIGRVRAYSVLRNETTPDPQRALIDAVARGKVDLAIAWGPLAGYYARRESVALDLHPVPPPRELPALTMSFPISMGVRHADSALAVQLDRALVRRREDIRGVLARFGVPLAPAEGHPPHLASRGPG